MSLCHCRTVAYVERDAVCLERELHPLDDDLKALAVVAVWVETRRTLQDSCRFDPVQTTVDSRLDTSRRPTSFWAESDSLPGTLDSSRAHPSLNSEGVSGTSPVGSSLASGSVVQLIPVQ